jgi:YfiR/HmsC-like
MHRENSIRCPDRLADAVHRLQAGVIWFFAFFGVVFCGRGAEYSEYEVKAAFLGNFIQFVKWPAKAFADAGSPFTICIVGSDSFGGALERAVAGQTVGGRKVAIKRSRRPDDLRSAQVVFVCKSERGRIGEILGGLQGANVLSVGESDDFARQGGVINFVMESDKVRFEVNTGAAQRAGLELSSKLLRLGKQVAAN